MKKFLAKYANVFAAFAMLAATVSVDTLCGYHYGQPPAPASLRKLRKF